MFVFRRGCLNGLLGVPFPVSIIATHFAHFYLSEEKERLLADIPVTVLYFLKLLKTLLCSVVFLTS